MFGFDAPDRREEEIGPGAFHLRHADICILNLYDAERRMGLHQDKDEREASIAMGVPVVSVSLGDTGRFLFGGTRRKDPPASPEAPRLASLVASGSESCRARHRLA